MCGLTVHARVHAHYDSKSKMTHTTKCTHSDTYTHIRTHIYIHHIHTHRHVHAHIYTQVQTHTHAHTHTTHTINKTEHFSFRFGRFLIVSHMIYISGTHALPYVYAVCTHPWELRALAHCAYYISGKT